MESVKINTLEMENVKRIRAVALEPARSEWQNILSSIFLCRRLWKMKTVLLMLSVLTVMPAAGYQDSWAISECFCAHIPIS